MKVHIHLLTLNHLDWTKECLRTLAKYTPGMLYDLVIFDNGSTDGTIEYLQENKYHILTCGENIGIPKARNLCMKTIENPGESDFFVPIHNDMFFAPFWLENLIIEIGKYPDCLMMGGAQIICTEPGNWTDEQKEEIADFCREDRTVRANLDPRLIKKKCLDIVGYWDELFSPHECEDCDYNKRVEDAGYTYLGTNRSIVFHYFSGTRLDLPGQDADRKRNLADFQKKHGGQPVNKWNEARRVLKQTPHGFVKFQCA